MSEQLTLWFGSDDKTSFGSCPGRAGTAELEKLQVGLCRCAQTQFSPSTP